MPNDKMVKPLKVEYEVPLNQRNYKYSILLRPIHIAIFKYISAIAQLYINPEDIFLCTGIKNG